MSAGMVTGLAWMTAMAQSENAKSASKPNILTVMADDCTHTDLPIYGGQNAKTPTNDKLITSLRSSLIRTPPWS